MSTLHFLLLVGALVSFLVAASGFSWGRVNPIGLGLAFWVATLLLPR